MKKFIKKIGFDSDSIIIMIDDRYEFQGLKPYIFKRSNILYINYIVFKEVLGFLIKNRGFNKSQAVQKIFKFLRKNNISFIKKSQINQESFIVIFNKLKKYRKKLKNEVEDEDLRIISVYKINNIDSIVSRNAYHFKPFCKYLGISFIGVKEDVDIMWRRTFG